MTGSSSKRLQIQFKWYQERKPNKIPKPEAKKTKTILHLHPLYCYIMDISTIVIVVMVIVNVNVIVTIVVLFSKAPQITHDLWRHQLAKT